MSWELGRRGKREKNFEKRDHSELIVGGYGSVMKVGESFKT